MRPKPWKGPEGWSGLAVDGWRDFPFHLLPWMTLARKRRAQGNSTCVKESDSRRVFRIDPAPPGRSESVPASEQAYAKRYLVNNLRRRMGRLLAGSRAEREFRLGLDMVRAGLPTPEPLACAENLRASTVGRFGKTVKLPAASYLLTRGWANDGSIPRYLYLRPGAAEPLALLLARFLAHLHASGFYHDDCSSEHFLVSPDLGLDAAVWKTREDWPYAAADSPLAVIDIDNGSLEPRPIDPARRFMNLFQVLRSLGLRAFPGRLRTTLLEEYLKRSGLEREYSPADARAEIERIARRKAGRSVFKK